VLKAINTATVTWLLRRVLELGGAYLVMSGTLSQDEVTQGTDAVQTIIGSGSLLIGLAWNVWSTFGPKK
jgi:hypothetical protein